MIIYNITLKVAPTRAAEWVRWMKEEHMEEVLQTGLFTDYRLSHLLEQDESDGITFVAQYFCDGMENYDTYRTTHGPRMQAKMKDGFGDSVVAFRTVMEVL